MPSSGQGHEACAMAVITHQGSAVTTRNTNEQQAGHFLPLAKPQSRAQYQAYAKTFTTPVICGCHLPFCCRDLKKKKHVKTYVLAFLSLVIHRLFKQASKSPHQGKAWAGSTVPSLPEQPHQGQTGQGQ